MKSSYHLFGSWVDPYDRLHGRGGAGQLCIAHTAPSMHCTCSAVTGYNTLLLHCGVITMNLHNSKSPTLLSKLSHILVYNVRRYCASRYLVTWSQLWTVAQKGYCGNIHFKLSLSTKTKCVRIGADNLLVYVSDCTGLYSNYLSSSEEFLSKGGNEA